MLQRAKDARVDIMMLTVDSVTGGNRERDLGTFAAQRLQKL
jgi:L-lactate dehydrogenase (cytochrome)